MTVSDRLMIFFTGMIAATGVIGSWIFGQQLVAMQGQLDEMKQSFVTERAYVLPARFDGYGAAAVAPNLTAALWFNNYGRTPGILKLPPQFACKYSSDGFRKWTAKVKNTATIDSNGLIPDGLIIPVDKPFGPFRAQLEATDSDINNARLGRGKIYCEYSIGYADVRDNIHQTDVCYFYDFEVKDFYLCAETGANKHT
jgi:hypothetical protein